MRWPDWLCCARLAGSLPPIKPRRLRQAIWSWPPMVTCRLNRGGYSCRNRVKDGQELHVWLVADVRAAIEKDRSHASPLSLVRVRPTVGSGNRQMAQADLVPLATGWPVPVGVLAEILDEEPGLPGSMVRLTCQPSTSPIDRRHVRKCRSQNHVSGMPCRVIAAVPSPSTRSRQDGSGGHVKRT